MAKNSGNKIVVKKILGINIANLVLKEVVITIEKLINSSGKKTIYGANMLNVNLFHRNEEFKKAFKNATLIYPEGASVVLASKFLESPLQEKTTLLDFILDVVSLAEKNRWPIYILGGKPKVYVKAFDNLKKKFPKLVLYGRNGYFTEEEEQRIITDINKKNIKILFVAFGSPDQEVWIDKNIDKIKAKAFFGIGGSIDVLAGIIPRAPKLFHENGFEWLYRVYKEPKRLWKRYLVGNSIFVFRVFVYKLKSL